MHNVYSLRVYHLKQPLNSTSLFEVRLCKVINLMNLCQTKQAYYHCYIPFTESNANIKIIIVLLMDVLKFIPKREGSTDA